VGEERTISRREAKLLTEEGRILDGEDDSIFSEQVFKYCDLKSTLWGLGAMAQACDPSYSGGVGRRIEV
jgi:hypothetical protein